MRLIYIRSLVTPARKILRDLGRGSLTLRWHSKKPLTTTVTLFARNRLTINYLPLRVYSKSNRNQKLVTSPGITSLHYITWSGHFLGQVPYQIYTPIAPPPSNSKEKYWKNSILIHHEPAEKDSCVGAETRPVSSSACNFFFPFFFCSSHVKHYACISVLGEWTNAFDLYSLAIYLEYLSHLNSYLWVTVIWALSQGTPLRIVLLSGSHRYSFWSMTNIVDAISMT